MLKSEAEDVFKQIIERIKQRLLEYEDIEFFMEQMAQILAEDESE